MFLSFFKQIYQNFYDTLTKQSKTDLGIQTEKPVTLTESQYSTLLTILYSFCIIIIFIFIGEFEHVCI